MTGVVQGDTRSLDYSSCGPSKFQMTILHLRSSSLDQSHISRLWKKEPGMRFWAYETFYRLYIWLILGLYRLNLGGYLGVI